MDVLMPEMDGLVAAEAICRRWPRGNRPLLIALTAMAGPGDQERCLRAGFDDYMSKPVRREDLTEALKAAVGYRSNREQAGLLRARRRAAAPPPRPFGWGPPRP